MSNETLAEQIARIQPGDKVTATVESAYGSVYQCISEARERPGGSLYIGPAVLRYSHGEPGVFIVSIDAHESVLPEVTEEPTDPGVRLVDLDGYEWARARLGAGVYWATAAAFKGKPWEALPACSFAPFIALDASGNAIGTVGGDRA